MTNPYPRTEAQRQHLSQAARKRWQDPEWAERQRAKIAEGQANASQRPTWASAIPPSRSKYADKRALTAYIDAESFQALHALSRKQRKSLSELVRTYIEWGLENEGANQ